VLFRSSSTEAEYRAIATATEEIEGVRAFLREIGIEAAKPVRIFTDNRSASFIANNPVGHNRMKHVALDYHFVRERTENGELEISFVPGKLQKADILTKPLPPAKFESQRSELVSEPDKVEKGGILE